MCNTSLSLILLHSFRPKLNRKINAMSYADKRGQGVYYNALGSNRKIHRKQVDLILPRQVSKHSRIQTLISPRRTRTTRPDTDRWTVFIGLGVL